MAELKKTPEGSKGKGLRKLPTDVRNKMGFMKRGGAVKKKIKKKKRAGKMGGGMMKKRMSRGGRTNKMGGGMMKKRMKRGGKA